MQLIYDAAPQVRNPYPGRGIVLGLDETGTASARGGLLHHGPQREQPQPRLCARRTRAFAPRLIDPSKMEDPSLIIYAPCAPVLKDHDSSSPTATRRTPSMIT